MICSKCGKDNPPDNRFCDNCGQELVAAGSTPVQPIKGVGASGIQCPNCKSMNTPDSAFCEKCGASLSAAPQPSPVPAPAPAPGLIPPAVKAGGVLVLPDSTELPVTAKKVIGRVDLAKYASPAEVGWISRQHFTIFEENGVFYIQDDKSTNGTKLDGIEIKQQGKQQVKDGSEILVGDAVKLKFKMKQ
jgi:hypothetical protein